MRNLSCAMIAVSAALVFMPVGIVLAQGTPDGGTATAAPSSTAAPETSAPEKEKAAPKKKKPARMTRQQEIDRSIERGTVPARYRRSVPKEYHRYIPFDRR
ncbi:hypothetical protein J6524_02295 [Bradyrhizobium sp. WSM 1738]|uniref:hypothetical protein n=1 Tax=Bradyrhizobium hereditatis TaxID=2821405 RepID=UPI001CE259FB|nr:hypothetical protein [Bradyrhizobium hereditatis]MCA6113763.1 hypothetical protein [Bradyrhizobium hereditatis]